MKPARHAPTARHAVAPAQPNGRSPRHAQPVLASGITGREGEPRIRVPIPGPRAREIVRRDEKFLVQTTKTAPVTAARALGTVVEDVDGNVLLDFASGIGVLNVGHCHPDVVAAIQDQAAKFSHFAGTDFYYDLQTQVAQRLAQIVPVRGKSGTAKTFFCNSGTEANEAAIKVAKHATGRHGFLAFLGAFHGRTQGSLALTASKQRQRESFFPTMAGVVHTPFPNPFRNLWGIDGYSDPAELTNRALDHVQNLFETVLPPSGTAACFWEPVQGEGGYIVPPKQFPRALQKLLGEHGILLCADEVQTGFGRTGKWFAAEHFGVKADIVSLAKAMGSGVPVGACVVPAKLDFRDRGFHSNTCGGNALACAASLATMDVIESERLVDHAAQMGAILGRRLDELRQRHATIGDHRGLGLMRAVEFVKPGGKPGRPGAPDVRLRDRVEHESWRHGLILLGCGKNSIRFIPPLNVSEEQIHGAMDTFEEALKAAKA